MFSHEKPTSNKILSVKLTAVSAVRLHGVSSLNSSLSLAMSNHTKHHGDSSKTRDSVGPIERKPRTVLT